MSPDNLCLFNCTYFACQVTLSEKSQTVFPLTFHHLHKCQKMCESALKFLQKCCSSSFVLVMPPFYNTILIKHTGDLKKNKLIALQARSFLRLARCSLKKGYHTANPLLSAFCGLLRKKSSFAPCQTLHLHKKRPEYNIVSCFSK